METVFHRLKGNKAGAVHRHPKGKLVITIVKSALILVATLLLKGKAK
jgi:hypothetical protein